jgi:HEAT repeat protein
MKGLASLSLGIWMAWGVASAQVDDLKSEDPRRRAKAAEALGKQNDARYIDPLRALLKDPVADVRAEATAAIVAIGTQHSLDPLIEASRDPQPNIQILAVDGMVNFYHPGYVQTGWVASLKKLTTNLKGRFTQINTQVIDAYVEVRPEVVEAIARVAVGGTSMEARALAARALGVLRARAATPQLVQALKTKESNVMLEALRALEKIGDRSAGPQVAYLLRDLDEKVQVAAIDATGQLQNREAIPVLQDVLKTSKRAPVRRAALVALAKLPDPSTQSLFQQYLNDRDRYLRAAAAEGLGRIGDAGDRDRLKAALDSERSESPRLSIAFALVHLGELNHLAYLLDGLNSTFHRGEARPFLVELARKPEVLERLYDPLLNGSNDQKKNLAYVLAVSGNAGSLPHLEKLTHDPNIEVAREAIRAANSLKARL